MGKQMLIERTIREIDGGDVTIGNPNASSRLNKRFNRLLHRYIFTLRRAGAKPEKERKGPK